MSKQVSNLKRTLPLGCVLLLSEINYLHTLKGVLQFGYLLI